MLNVVVDPTRWWLIMSIFPDCPIKKKRGMCQPRSSHIHPPAPFPSSASLLRRSNSLANCAASRAETRCPSSSSTLLPYLGAAARAGSGKKGEQMWKIWGKKWKHVEDRLESTEKTWFWTKKQLFSKTGGWRKKVIWVEHHICLVERSTMLCEKTKRWGNWASRSNSDLWMRSLAKPPETTETTWLSEHRLPRSIHLQ